MSGMFLRHSVDVFAGNLAGGLNLTSYTQLYYNLKQK